MTKLILALALGIPLLPAVAQAEDGYSAAEQAALEYRIEQLERQRQMDEYDAAQAKIVEQMNEQGDNIIRCGRSTC
jgi:hypothetical protein